LLNRCGNYLVLQKRHLGLLVSGGIDQWAKSPRLTPSALAATGHKAWQHVFLQQWCPLVSLKPGSPAKTNLPLIRTSTRSHRASARGGKTHINDPEASVMLCLSLSLILRNQRNVTAGAEYMYAISMSQAEAGVTIGNRCCNLGQHYAVMTHGNWSSPPRKPVTDYYQLRTICNYACALPADRPLLAFGATKPDDFSETVKKICGRYFKYRPPICKNSLCIFRHYFQNSGGQRPRNQNSGTNL